MIQAGSVDDISWDSGAWAFLDIGFSNKKASCGLLFGDQEPYGATFDAACRDLCTFLARAGERVNLVIEAPLSVAFDEKGNPKGRKPEKQGSNTRYWYIGLGCVVLTATTYLLREITQLRDMPHTYLFEGFVSFKDQTVRSSHVKDVQLLKGVVTNPDRHPGSILAPEGLRMDKTDRLQSAFLVSGMDFGVPPIIMPAG